MFYIQDFWATCAFPEKQSVSWNFSLYWIYFLHSGFLSNLRLPWKQSCPGIFHCIEICFIIRNFWSNCACPENRVCPENFQARGTAAPPPDPPPLTPMCRRILLFEQYLPLVFWKQSLGSSCKCLLLSRSCKALCISFVAVWWGSLFSYLFIALRIYNWPSQWPWHPEKGVF